MTTTNTVAATILQHANTAISETLVTITSAIMRSIYGKTIFPDTPDGEERFDAWQDEVLRASVIMMLNFNDNDSDNANYEEALDSIERSFRNVFPPIGV